MRIDKTQISGPRFMFSLAFFLQASAMLTSFIAGFAKQESWLVLLFGMALSLPIIYLFRTLMVMFPDKNLLQVLEAVYGKVIGKALGAAYVWFFITLAALNVLDLGDSTRITVMTETPYLVLALICVLVAVWAVRNGLMVVVRYAPLFSFVELGILALNIILLANQMDIMNLLPIFDMPVIEYVHSTHLAITILFGELVVFLMFTPSVKAAPKSVTKYWFGGAGVGMLALFLTEVRDIAVLGSSISMFNLPGLMVMRLVNMGETLSRMEILFSVALMMLMFFKITVLCYVSTIAVAQLFNVSAYKRLALIMGILIVVYAPTLYHNFAEHVLAARESVPIILTPFEIIIPLLTLIVAKVRKLPQKAETSA